MVGMAQLRSSVPEGGSVAMGIKCEGCLYGSMAVMRGGQFFSYAYRQSDFQPVIGESAGGREADWLVEAPGRRASFSRRKAHGQVQQAAGKSGGRR